MRRMWGGLLASLLAYTALTAVQARDLLAHPSTLIVHDAGDPILTASILYWNAWVLPLSDAWWQFPNFYPTTDTLAFSEHLLGLGPLATPLEWLTRDPIATANLVALLTFPLCGAAAFALVHRLTGHGGAAFVAGLAFAFSPFRATQLPHLQMLATFWAPLALLGLHGYVDTRRRRWLALYGVAWLLQVSANAYYLVFFSVLVGLWVLWFVVLRRDWRGLLEVTGATALAAVPLVPVLWRYVVVHARHGFQRGLPEVQAFSADLLGVLCASEHLTFWGWLRIGCRIEAELFPGLTLAALTAVALVHALGWWPRVAVPRTSIPVTVTRRIAAAAALLAVVVAGAVLVHGPLRYQAGPVRLSASSIGKPLVIAVVATALAFALSRRAGAALRRSETMTFYLFAAAVTWVLSLGPALTAAGTLRGPSVMPFMALMQLPGASGVRVPARFWMMSTLCLAVVAGLMVATLARRRLTAAVLVAVVGAGIVADGWMGTIQAGQAPPPVEDARALRGTVVLSLPAGTVRDIAPQYAAVVGGWRTVNGYSGYEPPYYAALLFAMQQELDDLFEPLRRRVELHVVVEDEAGRLRQLVERQPGAVRVSRAGTTTIYRLPRRDAGPLPALGEGRPIAAVRSECEPGMTGLATDGDPETRWYCGPQAGAEVLNVDLGGETVVGAVRLGLGRFVAEFPRALTIETSLDGQAWQPASQGPVAGAVIEAGLVEPRYPAPVIGFSPRPARFVRLRQTGVSEFLWSVADLAVGSGRR